MLSSFFLLEQSSGFAHFCSNPLAFLFLPLGVIFRFCTLLPQPACFPLPPSWSNLPVLHTFAPTRLLSYFFLLEQSSGFAHFCPNPLAFLFFPLGVIFRFCTLLLQPACFPILPSWSNLPVLHTFAPTRLLSSSFLLEQSSGFVHFCSNPLAFLFFPLGVIFRFCTLLLQPACFPILPSWSNLPILYTFAPIYLLPQFHPLEQIFFFKISPPIHAYTFSGHSINFQKIHKLYAYLHELTNPRKDKPT